MATLALNADATRIEFISTENYRNWFYSDNFDYPYSELTIRQYVRIATELVNFAKEEGLCSLEELNTAWLRKFINRPIPAHSHRVGDRYAPTTRITRQSALNLFWRWAMENEHAFDNPIEQLIEERSKDRKLAGGYGGRKPKRKPKVLKWDEQEKLLGQVLENPRIFTAARDYALVKTLLVTGLRTEEVCELPIHYCDLSAGRIRVIGKGNKERIIRFSPEDLSDAMKLWLPIREQQINKTGIDQGLLFITGTGAGLIPQGVYQQISGYFKKAGLAELPGERRGEEREKGGHILRHTAASRMLAKGLDIRTVMEYMGHENISTTEIYLHLLD